jgi:hypothetical protein
MFRTLRNVIFTVTDPNFQVTKTFHFIVTDLNSQVNKTLHFIATYPNFQVTKTPRIYCNGDPSFQGTKTSPIFQVTKTPHPYCNWKQIVQVTKTLQFYCDRQPIGPVNKYSAPTVTEFKYCRPLRCNAATEACFALTLHDGGPPGRELTACHCLKYI